MTIATGVLDALPWLLLYHTCGQLCNGSLLDDCCFRQNPGCINSHGHMIDNKFTKVSFCPKTVRYKTVCVSLRLWRGRAPPLAGLRAFLAAGRRPPVPPFSPARPKNAMNLQIVRQHATKSNNKQQFQDGRRHKNNDITTKKHRSGANDSKMNDQLPTGGTINGSSGVVLGSRDPLRGWGAARRAGETRPRAPPVRCSLYPHKKQRDLLHNKQRQQEPADSLQGSSAP